MAHLQNHGSTPANPWGVSLNRLSFRSASGSAGGDRTESAILSPMSDLKAVSISSPSAGAGAGAGAKAQLALKVVVGSTRNANANAVDDDVKGTDRRKENKRRLRRQLSLAKFQMKVLSARLNVETMKTPSTGISPATALSLSGSPSSSTDDADRLSASSHSMTPSTDSLFAAVESVGTLELDIKAAIEKVDDLQKEVSTQKQHDADSEPLRAQNESLSKELVAMKERVDALQRENEKLKDALNRKSNAADCEMAKSADNLTERIAVKMENRSQSADNRGNALYAKYDKMKKMGMSTDSIRNRMTLDGVERAEIERYLNADGAPPISNDAKLANDKLAKYKKMKTLGMPQHAVINKMRLDGLSNDEIERFKNR